MINDKPMIDKMQALPGRDQPLAMTSKHAVVDELMQDTHGDLIVPEGCEQALFAMGCFWGAERKFWQLDGVKLTAVGYAAGFTPNPTYEEVCSGLTGHSEVVAVVFNPAQVTYQQLLEVFWENHNPTQGMRQGNDSGTQYRSGIYSYNEEQQAQAVASKEQYQKKLLDKGFGPITTEIQRAEKFYFAETYHQQYLEKNPGGYCGLGGTGIAFG